MKYFITGAFSSAFFLYGVALLYGISGSTWLVRIAPALHPSSESAALGVLGVALLLVGFGFKVASVPFHMWVPDVYEGAPTTVTAGSVRATMLACSTGPRRRLIADVIAPARAAPK